METRFLLSIAAATVIATSAFAGDAHGPVNASVSVCFTPSQPCLEEVVAAIASASRSIRVQAYGFSSKPILLALTAAHQRGVDVQIILDKSDADEKRGRRYRATKLVAEAGISVWIDDQVHTAHNKVMVIDGHLIMGGSFNYTQAAAHKNAENVTFIDNPQVASWYNENWESRKAVSQPFQR
jgi:phosphatidylserine/phosphatidylglycerophosphate/cardiolipin synthase-like enzyme